MAIQPELLQKADITLFKGVSWISEFRISTGTRVYREISNIQQSAPVRIEVTAHGMPDGWDFWLTGVVGPSVLNRDEPEMRHIADVVDASTIEINEINGAGLVAYESGGWIKYLEPESLVGASATMIWRKTFDSAALVTLTSSPVAGIVLDDTAKTVTVTLSAANIVTLAAAGTTGVWILEVTLSGARVVTAGYGTYTILGTG